MTISSNFKDLGNIKKTIKNTHICPLCKKRIEIGVEKDILIKLNEGDRFPYPHIHLHGDPLHAMLCYIDKNFIIRNIGSIKSIEISRDSSTFNQMVKKWSNPF